MAILHILIGLPIAIGLWIGLGVLYKKTIGWLPSGSLLRKLGRCIAFAVLFVCGIGLGMWPMAGAPDPSPSGQRVYAILVLIFAIGFAWVGSGLPRYYKQLRYEWGIGKEH